MEWDVTVSGNVMESNAEADSWKTSFIVNGPLINDRLGLQLRGSYLDRQRSERLLMDLLVVILVQTKQITMHVGAKLDFKLDDQNSFWVDGFYQHKNMIPINV